MPFDTRPATALSLADRAEASLRAYFDSVGHRPGAEHWDSLRAILATIQGMADGTCSERVYLASLDCGTGKSQATAHATRTLVEDPAYRHMGVVVCVGRLSEVEPLVDAMALPAGALAVLTSNPTLNQLGSADVNAAQVLITTQQRVELACEGGLFRDAECFFFQGTPRAVRIWDEAWLPGLAVALSQDDIAYLFKPSASFPAFKAALVELYETVKAAEDGATIPIPDWEEEFDVSRHALLAAVAQHFGDAAQDIITGLMVLSGRVARVRRDGAYGAATINYRDTLPVDLAPLLVLDASIRIRQTYADMQAARSDIERLPDATKDYSPLTVHVWNRGGGKAAWREHRAELIEGIEATILSKPQASWLVVHHKSVNLRHVMSKSLPPSIYANVSFTTWGQHQASNEWRHVENVILAGTLFLRDSQYTALAYLSQGKSVADYEMPADAILKTRLGEYRHAILQAVCRGRCRQSDGVLCKPMDAYIIADQKTGIPEEITTIFPGCRKVRWEPIEKPLPPYVAKAVEVLDSAIGIPEIPEAVIRQQLGIDAKHWGREVVNRQEWKDALADRNVSITTPLAEGKRGRPAKVLLWDAEALLGDDTADSSGNNSSTWRTHDEAS